MHGLVVIEGMTLSGHPWIINEIPAWLIVHVAFGAYCPSPNPI